MLTEVHSSKGPVVSDSQAAELSERINEAEASTKRLVVVSDDDEDQEYREQTNAQSNTKAHRDIEAAVHSNIVSASDDIGSDDDIEDHESEGFSADGLEEHFRVLEEEVAVLVADIHDLALYTKASRGLCVHMDILSDRPCS